MLSATSQPSDGFELQSAKPGEQTIEQAPPLHIADAFGPVRQTLPHVPQFIRSVAGVVSQPFAATWSHSAWPAVHVAVQDPLVQTVVAFGTVVHA